PASAVPGPCEAVAGGTLPLGVILDRSSGKDGYRHPPIGSPAAMGRRAGTPPSCWTSIASESACGLASTEPARRMARAHRGRGIVPTPPEAIQSMRAMAPSPGEGSGVLGQMYGPAPAISGLMRAGTRQDKGGGRWIERGRLGTTPAPV